MAEAQTNCLIERPREPSLPVIDLKLHLDQTIVFRIVLSIELLQHAASLIAQSAESEIDASHAHMLAHKRHLAGNHDIHAGSFAIHQRGRQQCRALQASRISLRYSASVNRVSNEKLSTITTTAHTPSSKLHHQVVLSSVSPHGCPRERNSVIQGLKLAVSSAWTILQNALYPSADLHILVQRSRGLVIALPLYFVYFLDVNSCEPHASIPRAWDDVI